jgi:hypothetical protein|tara:strand:+ start:214 stop:1053 length:840 start_codon:yes stop_codon:yes gene_type:complete
MDILQLVIKFGPAVVKAMGYKNEDVDAAVESMTGGGINNSFTNMFTGGQGLTGILKNQGKKFLSKQAFKALTGGGSGLSSVIGPGLLLGGVYAMARATDPLRPGSRNYNPYLQDQLDYVGGLDGYLGTNPNSGAVQYGPNSVLHGKNALSMFGTNDYIGMLQKKQKYFQDRLPTTGVYSTGYAQKGLDKTNIELQAAEDAALQQELAKEIKTRNRKNYVAPYQGQVHGNGGGDGGNNNGGGGYDTDKSTGGSGDHRTMARGGIANVNMNRGQLGEQLRG